MLAVSRSGNLCRLLCLKPPLLCKEVNMEQFLASPDGEDANCLLFCNQGNLTAMQLVLLNIPSA